MSNIRIYGLPDLLALPNAVITADSEASASMAADNLTTEQPSEFWRSQGYNPTNQTRLYGYISGQQGGKSDMSVGGIGLINHNLTPYSGMIRFLLFSTAQGPTTSMFEVVLPNAVTASTNLSGVVGDVDDGFAPDGVFIGPSNPALDWMATFSFAAPTSSPEVGAYKQSFWVYASSQVGTQTPAQGMTMIVKLYSGTTFVRSLGKKMIYSTTADWTHYDWDMQEVIDAGGNANGSGVRIRIECAHGNTAVSELIKISSVAWHCDRGLITGASGYEADSGWLQVGQFIPHPNGSSGLGTGALRIPNEILSGECIAYSFDQVYSAIEAIYVLFREDHSPSVYDYDVSVLTASSPGFIKAGKLLACPEVFVPGINLAYGQVDGYLDLSVKLTTDGGQTFGSRRRTKRTATLSMSQLTQAEQAWVKDRWVRRRGAMMPVLVQILPGDALEDSSMTFYAEMRLGEVAGTINQGEGYGRQLILTLEEKL